MQMQAHKQEDKVALKSEMYNIAVLGAGGLGMAAAGIINGKKEMKLTGIVDKLGYAIDHKGLDLKELQKAHKESKTIAAAGTYSSDSLGELITQCSNFDAIFIALPNYSNSFIPDTVKRFAEAGYGGVIVDVLKRTSAVEMMFGMHDTLRDAGITYITGTGATPGLLTAAAALAAQSFQEVLSVDIRFGVGVSNWEAYRATIREDIAHLEGFDLEKVRQMTCDDIMAELDSRNGILDLKKMEHADDIMLEHAGVVDREKVTVGGIVDVRNPKKPISTTMTLTGRTHDGAVSSHTFTLGDETTMAANVVGPALGWIKAGIELNKRGVSGVFASCEVMPKFVR